MGASVFREEANGTGWGRGGLTPGDRSRPVVASGALVTPALQRAPPSIAADGVAVAAAIDALVLDRAGQPHRLAATTLDGGGVDHHRQSHGSDQLAPDHRPQATFVAVAAFKGWTDEAIEFFDGLEVDNSKAYWEANKEVYLRAVKAPMEALLRELAPDHGDGKIFRPYRDVRFSKDKTPYKTNIAAILGNGGYVSLSAGGLGAGSGMYHMAADQLERYRRAVDADRTGTEIAGIVSAITAKGHEVIAHGVLKTAPRGFAKDHPRIDLLRSKGLTVWRQWDVAPWLSMPKAKAKVLETLDAARPLNAWLAANVGESQSTEGDDGR
jgi:uncharacterized protein (TIGR02453 family)